MDSQESFDTPFEERVRDAADRLTGADNKTLRAILENPKAAALLTVSELAQRAQVHEATATRLAQKLGYKGFPAMREALQETYISGADGAQRIARSVDRIGEGNLLEDLVATEVEALLNLPHHINEETLAQAADLMAAARRVFIFAMGNAAPLSDMLDRRLRRFGFDTVVIAGDPRAVAEKLALITSADCVLAMAFRAKPMFADGLFAAVDATDARLILIADLAASAMLPMPTLALAAPRGRSGEEFQTLTVPMAVLNALVLTIARRHRERTSGALDAVTTLINQLR